MFLLFEKLPDIKDHTVYGSMYMKCPEQADTETVDFSDCQLLRGGTNED